MSITLVRRVLIIAVMVPMMWVGAAGGRYVLGHRRVERLSAGLSAAPFPEPGPSSRILVISPHPDDETLGTAGLLQRCSEAGGVARVVFLTDGDGFRVAVERQFRKVPALPADYRRFAVLRRAEALRACALLGVGRRSVRFMGFPDRGLKWLLNANWSSRSPFRSRETRLTACPDGSVCAGAPYSGEALLDALTEEMERFRPTMILASHPSDDHQDHSAAAAFAELALNRLRDRGAEWARRTSFYAYLIHRGDWPQPQGLNTQVLLRPPAQMLGLAKDWQSLPLTPGEVARKADALDQYVTQMTMTRRFLCSFVRASEVFIPYPITEINRTATTSSSWAGQYETVRPIAIDAVADNIVRALQPDADISAVSAVLRADVLYVAVQTARPPSGRVRTRVTVRPVRGAGKPVADLLVAEALGNQVALASPASTWSTESGVGFAFPVGADTDSAYFVVDAETRIGLVPVDRIGPRVVCASPPAAH